MSQESTTTPSEEEDLLHPDLRQLSPVLRAHFEDWRALIEAQGNRLSLFAAAFVTPSPEEGRMFLPQVEALSHGDDWQVTSMLLGLVFRAAYEAGAVDKLLRAIEQLIVYYQQAEDNKKARGH